jgi:hypothetical protein
MSGKTIWHQPTNEHRNSAKKSTWRLKKRSRTYRQ